MKRWHQGHSLGAGLLGGLLVAQHVWLVFVLGICTGITLAYARQLFAFMAGAYRQHRGPAKRERIETEPAPGTLVPVYRVPRETEIPY